MMNVTPSVGTYFSGVASRPESSTQRTTPYFGSDLSDIREATQTQQPVKTITDTVLFTYQKKEITVAHVLADLYEEGPKTLKKITIGLPNRTLQKLTPLLKGLHGSLIYKQNNSYYLLYEGLNFLKREYPDIILPKEGYIYNYRTKSHDKI